MMRKWLNNDNLELTEIEIDSYVQTEVQNIIKTMRKRLEDIQGSYYQKQVFWTKLAINW